MRVFVITKFDDAEMDMVYHDCIKSPLENEGHVVTRADDPSSDEVLLENIHDHIVQSLWDADIVIADLTRDNVNVAYELGIAHALNKRTIQISQNLDIQFDLKSQLVISYGVDNKGKIKLSKRLLDIIRRTENEKYISSNIVHDYIKRTQREIITNPPARK